MASASSSIVSTSSQLPTSSLTLWDVFISFRGIDTRYTFTDHLYEALQRTGIRTFMDDPELRSGDVISDGLIQAIQNSKVYVVVFSKNYASSTWCLDELVEILNCHKTMQKLVIPVYHNIDSSVVRHQTKSFKSAFKKHESRPKLGFFRRVSEKDTIHTAAKLEQIEKWRHTLSEVAGFSGQTMTAQRNEADIVDEIVEKILIEINPITLHVTKYPVGLDSHVENITALMSSHPGVTKIGIYGMGGVGKTTLAKAVYNQNYRRFQGSCFLENVRECSVTTRGLVCLQQQLIDNVLKCTNINIDNVNHGIELIKARISSIKVLIVFDDLDDPRSMEFLEGKFALGSIILITTRNEDLLDLINVEAKYKVNELGDAESRQLFAQHAFGDNIISYTSTKSFEEILEHAGGLPLALEVFGSNLLNQSEESWTHFSDELKQVSLNVVERKLMISFDALKSVDPMLQDIFLDIACFFMGWNVEEVVKIMETCYTFLGHNIDILKKRSLLTINNRDELGMHDLLRNMGRKIVRNSSPNEPGKHSRLWVSKDICHVLEKHLGTEAVKGIISSNFNHQDALEGVSFNTETFKRMSKLRFLKLNKVKLFGSFEQKFGNLRWLCWDGCPLKYLPLEFYPQKLVILELPHSKIGTMGKLNKVFEKLKTLNMKHSLDLTTTPNFNQFPHLEALNFESCESLEEVHMSIGSLERLVILNLHGCVNLRSLPGSICNLRALKSLNIGGCISLKELPTELGNLESLRELNAEHLTVVKLPDSIGRLSNLVELGLNHNKNLKTLPDSICNLRSLNSLHIAGCSGLEELPKELGKIESITKLNAWGLTVSKLPDSINCLSKLVELNLNDNKYLEIPPSSLSASGSAPTNRDVLSLREKAKVNDLIDGNKKASEGGSAARKFTYSEVPRNSEITSNKQVKFSDTISSIEMDDPDMEGQQIGRDPSANWSSRNSPYTADDHITSYSPYLPPVLEEPSSSFSKDDDPLPAVEGLQISGEPYPGQISELHLLPTKEGMKCFPFNIRKGKDDTKPSKPASFQSSETLFTSSSGTGKSGSELNSWNVSDSSTNSGKNRNTFANFSQQSSNLRAFTFADLKFVTQNFSRSTKIGEGGFGCVYRGVVEISEDPKKLDVAVKRLGETGFQGHKEWVTEVNVLGVVEHPNLVKLVGYCAEDDERGIQRLLVYEFMPNGSVRDHLSTRSQNFLSWDMRLKVAQDTARGLAYLHEDMNFHIIFRDFKSSNILLDENWNAKLSDFGLARLGPHVSTAVVGKMGYAAPEYIQTGRLTSKSDVWSYGIFLYELITGRQPIDRNRPESEQKLLEWVRPYLSNPKKFRLIIDPRFEGKYPIKSALKLSKIANQCLARNPKMRPKMSEVLEMVNQIIDPLTKAEGSKPERTLSVPTATPNEAAHKESTEQTGRIRDLSKLFGDSWLARNWLLKLVKTS